MNDDVTVINNSIREAKRLVDTSFYSGVLFCGDFNFPSLDWNAEGAIIHESAESNAQKFVDTIDDLFLSQFVIEPTFQLDNKTCINTLDLIFSDCPKRISDSICHLPPLGKLDKAHHILRWNFKMKTSNSNNQKQNTTKLFNMGNYKEMENFFNNIDWLSEFGQGNVNQCYEIFLTKYQLACEKFIPLKKHGQVDTRHKWLNKNIRIKSKWKNKLWFRLRASGYKNEELLYEYNKYKKELQKEITNSKWNFERDLVFKAKSNPKLLYSYIKNKQHVKNSITLMKNKQGIKVTRPNEVADTLNTHFKDVFGKEEDDEMPSFEIRTTNTCPIPIVTESQVYDRLVELDVHKSIGVDGVSPFVLLNCARVLSKPLC